jgi:hypothetical protein
MSDRSSERSSDRSRDINVVPEPDKSPTVIKWVIIALGSLIGIIVVSLIVALIGGIAGSDGIGSAFRVIRDFFIIVLALQGILISVALIVLVLQLTSLINLLRNEIKPLLDEARYTLSTVRGTTEFVSKNVTSPVIRVASTVAGVRAFFTELAGLRNNVNSHADRDGRK